jgi:Phosphatidylinositol 3- and 4-kinase/FATC domain
MAGLFYIGALECDKVECETSVLEYSLNLKLNTIQATRKFENLCRAYPKFNLASNYAGTSWKGLQYCISKNLPNSSCLISLIMQNAISPLIQSHYFKETLEILKNYLLSYEIISFKFIDLRVHEKCTIDNCNKFPCCYDLVTCSHIQATLPEVYQTNYNFEESTNKIETLIYSFLYFDENNPIWKLYKPDIIIILRQGTYHTKIRPVCVKVLYGIGEYNIDMISEIDILENLCMKHSDPQNLLKVLIKLILKGQNCPRLLEYCIEMLKFGIDIENIDGIEKIIRSPDGVMISCLLIKNHLKEEFKQKVHSISSCLFSSDHASKKIRNDEEVLEIKAIEIKDLGTEEKSVLFKLLTKAIQTKIPDLIKFFYMLTGNELLEPLTDKSKEVKDFHIYIDLIQPDSYETSIISFPYNYKCIQLGIKFCDSSFIDIYQLLCMIPVHTLLYGPKYAFEFIDSCVNELLLTGFKLPSLENYTGKAVGSQITAIIKSLIRVIQFLIVLNNLEVSFFNEFIVGNDEKCFYCGENVEKFCYSCGKICFPIVFPIEFLNLTLELKYYKKVSMNANYNKPKFKNELNLDKIKLKAIKAMEHYEKPHSCIKIISNSHAFQLAILIKHLGDIPEFSLPINCITIPVGSQSHEVLQNIREYSLYSKLYCSKLISNLEPYNITSSMIKVFIKVAIWPDKQQIIQSMSIEIISLLIKKYKLTFDEMINLINDEVLLKWVTCIINFPGFLGQLLSNFSIDIPLILIRSQPLMILNMGYTEFFYTLESFCKECDSSLMIYYTNMISEIAWTGKTEKLKTLESLASKIIKGCEGNNINISDIYTTNITKNYQISLLLLLCKLGLENLTCDWLVSTKFNSTQITLPESNYGKFMAGYTILTNVFYKTEVLSQVVQINTEFGWEQLFSLAELLEEITFSEDTYKINSLLGLGKLCLYFLESNRYEEYLTHKIIGICSQLLCLDINLMLQLLYKVISSFKCKDHHIAILSLAFIGRSHSIAFRIIDVVLKDKKSIELTDMSLCHFMCFAKLIDSKIKVFDKLYNSIKSTNKNIIDIIFNSLCCAIVENFPIIQYAALSIVDEVLKFFPCLSRGEIGLSLNEACSLQSSRDNIKELSFPLGLSIDKIIGKVGAVSDLEKNHQVIECSTFEDALKTCENLYNNSERLYLCKKMLKCNKTTEEVEGVNILSKILIETPEEMQEAKYEKIKSLREWTELLIRVYKIDSLFPCIPLIKKNLELVRFVLAKIFNKKSNRIEYFVEYLEDFFRFSNVGHRRLMLKILEKCPSLHNKLKFETILTQLIDLQEYPKALFLIEKTIRTRISLSNLRYSPDLINSEEMNWCKKVYSGLFNLRYIEAVPKYCKEILNEDSELGNLFNQGSFLLLSSHAMGNSKYYVGACWRVGVHINSNMNTNIEYVLSSVFNSETDLKTAVEKSRKFLIAQSSIRSAAYSQAYEHILIQHIFENLIQIEENLSDYFQISNRNSLIENKFEYKEIAYRACLVLYRRKKETRNIISAFRDLFKNAVLHKKFEYCRNLLIEMKLLDKNLDSPILLYYKFKYQMVTNNKSQYTKSMIRSLWKKILLNTETPLENGYMMNMIFKMKLSILYIKAKCMEEINNLDKLEKKYLAVNDDIYQDQRTYLEKSYYFLANHYDKFLSFEINIHNSEIAIRSAILYCKSLTHGHSCYYHSMTRLLTLYFGICNIKQENLELVNLMQELSEKIPLFIWADRLGQVISATGTSSVPCKKVLITVLSRLLIKHPEQMAWFVYPLMDSTKSNEDFRNKIALLDEVIQIYRKFSKVDVEYVNKIKDYLKGIVSICKSREKKITIPSVVKNLTGISLALPIKENFEIQEYDKSVYHYEKDLPGFPTHPILLKKVHDKVATMPTKAAPVKILITGSDDRDRYFLCKYDKSSDMRKESRMITIFSYINRLLFQFPYTKRLRLRIPVYSILFIGSDCGIVEWVDGTVTVKSIITKCLDRNSNKSIDYTKKLQKGSHEQKEIWNDIQKLIRPSFHEYFIENYKDNNAWHRARIVFTRSLAAWSIVGYIIGLGDRHCDNILFIEKTAELVFIDFECIFNMGKILPKPEVVPFRLTPELQDAMGLFFEEAEFVNACELVLECLKSNKHCLLSQFESFVSDPLSMKITNPDIDNYDINLQHTLKIVQARLDGKKNFNKDDYYKSTRHQVESLIKEATNPEKLRVMFHGWMPWQ